MTEAFTFGTSSFADASHANALRFITCGSVDDGKSTLIGRLLVDTKAVLQDHLAGVQRHGATDLALLTDGLMSEREQGITIDVAYRYFATEERKFIIGDAPGHEQYTRNMVTAASQADAAVVLVDASKLDWRNPNLQLLTQTKRHSLLLRLLRVPSIVYAINKLDMMSADLQPGQTQDDAKDDASLAFANIHAALTRFAKDAGITPQAIIPISALTGDNVVDARPDWCGYKAPAGHATLLEVLQDLPTTAPDVALPFAQCVQWVEKHASSNTTTQGRRIFWGRIAAGRVAVGDAVALFPSGKTAKIAQILSNTRQLLKQASANSSVGITLDHEVDVSRGDWITHLDSNKPNQDGREANPTVDEWGDLVNGVANTNPASENTALQPLNYIRPAYAAQTQINATVAWLDDEPLQMGRVYWALHGHRWVKAKVQRLVHRLDINTLQEDSTASNLSANSIGHVELLLQQPLITQPFATSRQLGSLILVDTTSHRTAAAVLVDASKPD